jgi:hypothetical protein
MGKKNHVSSRGQGELYDEPKTEQVMLLLTRTGRSNLDRLAKLHGLSRSELVERIARGQFHVVSLSPSHWKRLIHLARSYIPPRNGSA